jgi:hypothetical protein
VRAADQRRAVPDSPISVGLQNVGKGLVDTAQLRQARALAYGRAYQRVAEPDGMHLENHNRGLFRGFESLEGEPPAGYGARGGQDLSHVFAVVQRRDLQKQPSVRW